MLKKYIKSLPLVLQMKHSLFPTGSQPKLLQILSALPQTLNTWKISHLPTPSLTVPTAPTFCCEKTARIGLDPSFYGTVLREVLCQNTAWERWLCCCMNLGVLFPALYFLYAHSYLQVLHLQSILIQPARWELHQPQMCSSKNTANTEQPQELSHPSPFALLWFCDCLCFSLKQPIPWERDATLRTELTTGFARL